MSKKETVKKFLQELLEEEQTVANNGQDDYRELVGKVQYFLEQPADFQPGDVVTWKNGLKNKKYPGENQFAVVIQQLDNPIIQIERDSGTPYFREPLDLMLAVLDNEGDLLVFHYDKRRFNIVQQNGARLSEEVIQGLTSKKTTDYQNSKGGKEVA
jgi:hypothetical protein